MQRKVLTILLLTFGPGGFGVSLGAERGGPGRDLAEALLETSGVRAGFCVILGRRDAELGVALARAGNFLIHQLVLDEASLERVRLDIRARKLYGQASVELLRGDRLPYADNLANLVVVDNVRAHGGVPMKEIMRVLCPEGVALISQDTVGGGAHNRAPSSSDIETVKMGGKDWIKIVKPRPAGMDTWTHLRRGPDGHMVSRDAFVGIPSGVRWIGGPDWPIGIRKGSVANMIAGRRQFFCITLFDIPSLDFDQEKQIHLVARDAFNGLVLWKVPLQRCTLKAFRKERPPLIQGGDKVYAGSGRKTVAFDGATGKKIFTTEMEGSPVLYHEGILIVGGGKTVNAIDGDTGKIKWTCQAEASASIRLGEGRLFAVLANRDLLSLDFGSGQEVWKQSTADWPVRKRLTLCTYHDGKLVFALGKGIRAVSAKDGECLWDYQYNRIGHGGSYANHFFLGGKLWLHAAPSDGGKGASFWEALDPETGKVEKKIKAEGGHHCYPDRATEKYIMYKELNFIDWQTGEERKSGIGRFPCRIGPVLGNSIIYTAPFGCRCNGPAVIRGFAGLVTVSEGDARAGDVKIARLEKGAAYDRGQNSELRTQKESTIENWPMYRHDPMRTGRSSERVSPNLKVLWEVDTESMVSASILGATDWVLHPKTLGGVTAPVVGKDVVIVALPHAHRILAMDAKTGKRRWRFTTGGRVDSPPTLAGDVCLFGCYDGWVYCLRTSDGRLVWRYLAAPEDRRILAYGQLESSWPVSGSVLVKDGVVLATAGRSSAADGGIRACGLDVLTGMELWRTTLPTGEKGLNGLNDILVAEGEGIYLRNLRLDPKTGQPTRGGARRLGDVTGGILDGSWTRQPWAFHRMQNFWGFGRVSRPGQLLVWDEKLVYGFLPGGGRSEKPKPSDKPGTLSAKTVEGKKSAWTVKVPSPMQIEAILLAGDTLFVAGPVDRGDRNNKGGFLWTISASDGKKGQEIALSSGPVYGGLAAADGRLFVSTAEGKLLCFGN